METLNASSRFNQKLITHLLKSQIKQDVSLDERGNAVNSGKQWHDFEFGMSSGHCQHSTFSV
jgi:hypothetical protein